MTFTDKQLKFIEEHSAEIDSGEITEVAKAISQDKNLSYTEKSRLELALVYVIRGPQGFKVDIEATPPDTVLEGVVKSRLGIFVSGVPLLPSMYGKTKLRLYKIENNKITKQESYKLVGLGPLNEKMADYNLAVLDKDTYTDKVEQKYNGSLNYKASLMFYLRDVKVSNITYSEIITNEHQKVKELLKIELLNNFKKISDLPESDCNSIINYAMAKADIKGV